MRTLVDRRPVRGVLLVLPIVLGLMLVVGLPRIEAQPPPPALVIGAVEDVVINGEPWDGVTPLQAVNAQGEVVGTALVADGVFSLEVPPEVGDTFRVQLGDSVSEPIDFVAGAPIFLSADEPLELGAAPAVVEAVTRRVELSAGFQGLTHVGEDASIEEFLALFLIGDAVSGIFVWDGESQGWTSWRRGLPEAFQQVTSIAPRTPMLLSLESATAYESASLAYDGGASSIVAGFSGIPFLNESGSSVSASIEGLPTISSIFRFNNETGGWDSFRAALPASLNSLQSINRWDLLLVESSGPASWSYPAFTPE